MNGFWFIVCSIVFYDIICQERKYAFIYAHKYQKQKAKVKILKYKLNSSKK